MQFNPVSGRHNFLTLKNPDYFKQQIEQEHATETFGFADDLKREMNKLEWCDLIWQFPTRLTTIGEEQPLDVGIY